MGISANIKFNSLFDHSAARVDLLEKDTARLMDKFNKEIADIIAANPELTREKIYSVVTLVDDLPLDHSLAKFCKEVRKANPRLKLGIRSGMAHRRIRVDVEWRSSSFFPLTILCEVWLYLPEQPYALMRLGYKDYATTSTGNNTYGVYSRLISNRKYKSGQQQCMLMSNDMERAVKNAKTVMRPYIPQEIVQVHLNAFVGSVKSEAEEMNSTATTAAYEVRHDTNVMQELTHLLESGYQFLSDELRKKIAAYVDARKAAREHNAKARHAWFVTVTTRQDVRQFDVIEMFDVHKPVPVMRDAQTYADETLPEEIAGKMAVMTMIEVGARVPDVGMRATETTFYVERV